MVRESEPEEGEGGAADPPALEVEQDNTSPRENSGAENFFSGSAVRPSDSNP